MANYTLDQYSQLIQQAEAAGDTDLAQELTRRAAQEMRHQSTATPQQFAQQVAQSASLNLLDELASIASPAAAERMRQQQAEFRTQHPGLATAADIGGGLATGFGIGGLARGLPAASRVGRTLLAPRMLPQAAVGAAEGGIAGAGAGETPMERITRGAAGAGLGAALGGLGGGMTGLLRARAMPETTALGRMRETIEQDIGRITPQQVARMSEQAAEMPQMTLAELAGPTSIGYAQAVRSVPQGGARTIIDETLQARRETMGRRLSGALGEAVGSDEGAFAAAQRLQQQARDDAAPLYERAYQTPVRADEGLLDLAERGIDTGVIKRAYQEAASSARLEEGVRLPSWDQVYKDLGGSEFDVRTWDYIKRGLDDQIKDALRNQPSKARNLLSYKNQILERLDKAAPEYAAARRAYAGPKAQEEALEQGRKFLREDAEFTDDYVKSLSDAERQSYLIGASSAIGQRLKAVTPGGGMPRFTEDHLDKIRAAFGEDRQAADQFINTLMTERGMQQFRNMMVAQSPTANILAAQQLASEAGPGRAIRAAAELTGAAGELLRGNVLGAAQAAGQAVGGGTARLIPERLSEPLARMLMAQGPERVTEMMQRIMRPPALPAVIAPTVTGGMTGVGMSAQERMRMARPSVVSRF